MIKKEMQFAKRWILISIVVLLAISALGVAAYFRAKRPPFVSIAQRGADRAQLDEVRSASRGAERIFVSVASYRDPECTRTVRRLLEHAAHPERVRIVVCEQNEASDAGVSALAHEFAPAQLELLSMRARDAHGPLWARLHILDELQGEDFVLQIDSHTYPAIGWDALCIDEWRRCGDGRAILTAYPNNYDRANADGEKDTRTTELSLKYVNADGIPEFQAFPKEMFQPQSSRYWAAGFSFAPSEAFRNLDILKGISKDLFFGEEILLCLVLWTNGWNFYSPSVPLAWHLWDRSYRPTFWEQSSAERDAQAKHNLEVIREILNGRDRTLLGNARSQSEVKEFLSLFQQSQ